MRRLLMGGDARRAGAFAGLAALARAIANAIAFARPTAFVQAKAIYAAALAPAALALVVAAGCALPSYKSASAPPVVQSGGFSGSFAYRVDLGSEPRDVYFVFTNTSLAGAAGSNPSVGKVSVNGLTLPAPSPHRMGPSDGGAKSLHDRILELNRSLGRSAASRSLGVSSDAAFLRRAADTVGDRADGAAIPKFYDFNSFDVPDLEVGAICRYVSPVPVAVPDGSTRTLNIWVADDCWSLDGVTEGDGSLALVPSVPPKRHVVTQAMVDAIAARFLTPDASNTGAANDIYDWVTAALGPEWGEAAPSGSIPFDAEITILLADIQNDESDNGGTVGYFSLGNSYATAYHSNGRIMFVIDAVMYANPDSYGYSVTNAAKYTGGPWSATGSYWAGEVFSTLAHELQHMIQFYRKGVLVRGDGSSAETWIDEMCSQLVEDLVADKLDLLGPRGVNSGKTAAVGSAGPAGNIEGRIPLFNEDMSLGLAKSSSYTLADYSTSYAFGAWLARNYGGAELVRRIVFDPAVDAACITRAASAASGRTETMPDLLARWAISVLASDRTDMPPGYRYNTGGFADSSVGGVPYRLGSIDFFNYKPAPTLLSAAGTIPSGSFPAASNVYFLAGSGLSGKLEWSISTPPGVAFGAYMAP